MAAPGTPAYNAMVAALRDISEEVRRENERLGLKWPFRRVNYLYHQKDIKEFYANQVI